jgi:hypothetical protein
MSCRRIDATTDPLVYPNPGANIMPGWICCACRGYNGYQRDQCKDCGHEACFPCTEGEKLIWGRQVARGQGDFPTADPRYDVAMYTRRVAKTRGNIP